MPTIGGSLFIHNAIEFDYCIWQAIQSLLPICDEVSVLDCGSTDGTFDLVEDIARISEKLIVKHLNHWIAKEQGKAKWSELRKFADAAKSILNTEYHIMLQADEILHPSSYEAIKRLIQEYPKYNSFVCFRYNLYGNFNTYVDENSKKRPCGDYNLIRLAKRQVNSWGDAESLEHVEPVYNTEPKAINLIHYGFVRDGKKILDKAIEVGQWFTGGDPDTRIVDMKQKEGCFKPYDIIPKEEMKVLPLEHPDFMKDWIKEREHYYA